MISPPSPQHHSARAVRPITLAAPRQGSAGGPYNFSAVGPFPVLDGMRGRGITDLPAMDMPPASPFLVSSRT